MTIRQTTPWSLVGAVALCCAALWGCRSTTHATATSPELSSQANAVLLDTTLSYLVEEAAGPREIHTPMVRARVSGVECWLIIDSGATEAVFTRALATKLGASLRPTDPGTDHAGAAVASWISEDVWSLAIDDWQHEIKAPLVIDGPPPFEGWDIGGFLSPQQLHPGATTLLDLRRQRLVLTTGAVDERQIADLAGLELLSLPRAAATGDAARLLLVEATLASASVRVMLNTGGQGAEFSPSALGVALSNDASDIVESGQGVSGATVMGIGAYGAVLAFAETAIALDDILVREHGPSYDGQLGMHTLRGSVLVVGPERAQPIRWWRPGRGLPVYP